MEAIDIHTHSFISQIHWRPGIGDPTIVGWFTVAAYFTTFLLSVTYAKHLGSIKRAENTAAQHKLWWFVALVMLFMGINKQLDLQTLLTEVGKILSKQQGWYEQRRIIQAVFVAGVGCGGFLSLMLIWRSYRNLWKENWMTITGLTFLVCFVVTRAASFHHMDLFLGSYISGFKINWLLELGGITCIIMSVVMHLRFKPGCQQQMVAQKKDVFI